MEWFLDDLKSIYLGNEDTNDKHQFMNQNDNN